MDRNQVQALADGGNKRAVGVLAALRELSFHLSGAQVGITAVTLVLGVVSEPWVEPLFEGLMPRDAAVVVALGVVTVAQMVVGELVPKNLTISNPLRSALYVGNWLRRLDNAVRPVVQLFDSVANRIVRWFGIVPQEELVRVRSLDELDLLIRSSAADGVFDKEEFSLLERSISFGEKTAADALVPRTRLEALARTATVADLVALALECGHSRFPVFHDDIDNVIGIAHVKDVYMVPKAERATATLERIVQPVYAIPETLSLATLLVAMRARGSPMAVVIDEYGGTAGVITLEDLVEEIVGDIEDEYDTVERPPATMARAGVWLVDGMLHHDELVDVCGYDMPDGEWDTLAGFLLARFERIPRPGDRTSDAGWTFEIAEMERRRIARVRVTSPEVGSER